MNKQSDPTQRIYSTVPATEKGIGPGVQWASPGTRKDCPDIAEAGSESVTELVEEGHYFEAGVISGVEESFGAQVDDVYTKQVPEDDVTAQGLRKAGS